MLREEEIRPAVIFDEYLNLVQRDCDIFFSYKERYGILCPACSAQGELEFIKDGFHYEQCKACYTLYVSPRPSANDFYRYYTESASVKYWATTFYKKTAEIRREKLWKPKAELIQQVLQSYNIFETTIIDIGGGYGVFIETIQEITSHSAIVIEPSPSLSEICKQKGLVVIEQFLEKIKSDELPDVHKTFVSFELFEHLHDPFNFLEILFNLMKPGDFFIFTTLSSSGVDIQTLWKDSKAITPPQHLNFFNPHSIRIILEKTNFKILEISTPGKLDMDIIEKNKTQIKDRFWRVFIDLANSAQKDQMQDFIAKNGFSSHMMIVCCKN